jgi:uncharacterized protein (TIGR02246 family)
MKLRCASKQVDITSTKRLNDTSQFAAHSTREGTMKCTIFAVFVLVVGCCSLPVSAQQQDAQELRNAITAISAQEIELTRNKDAAGAASLFTSDALIVMLAPKLAVKPGREAIQKHIQGLIEAGLTNLTIEAQQVEPLGNDAAWAVGTYSITIKDKTIEGNWFRI